MDNSSWLLHVLVGGGLGIIGQLFRSLATAKKVHDEAEALGVQFGQLFDWSQFFQMAFVGFVAGFLASLAVDVNKITFNTGLAIFAAGYSGADFLAAFLKKRAPTVEQARKVGWTITAVQPTLRK